MKAITITKHLWNINEAAREMKHITDLTGMPTEYIFNGVLLRCDIDTPEHNIVRQLYDGHEENSKKHRESPQYKINLAKQEEERIRNQSIVDELMSAEKMDKLSVNNLEYTLDWLKQIINPLDSVYTKADKQLIANALKKGGFISNEYAKRTDLENDKIANGKWICGQVIKSIERIGLIPPVTLDYILKWEKL